MPFALQDNNIHGTHLPPGTYCSNFFYILDVFCLPLRLANLPQSKCKTPIPSPSKKMRVQCSVKEDIRSCNKRNKTTCPARSRHFRERLPMQRPPCANERKFEMRIAEKITFVPPLCVCGAASRDMYTFPGTPSLCLILFCSVSCVPRFSLAPRVALLISTPRAVLLEHEFKLAFAPGQGTVTITPIP